MSILDLLKSPSALVWLDQQDYVVSTGWKEMARYTTKFRFVISGMVWGFLVLVHHHRHTSPQEEQATRSKQQWRKGSKSGGSDSKHTQQVPSRLCSFARHWPRKTTSSCLGMRRGKTKDPGRNGIIMYSPAKSPTVPKLTSLLILWFKCFLPNRFQMGQNGSRFKLLISQRVRTHERLQ